VSVIDSLSIARAYELVSGASTASAKRIGRHLRVQCPDRSHDDSRASCDLDVQRNVWACRSCSAAGGVLDLAIAAGHARDHAEAAQWFEERICASGRDSYVYTDESGNPVGRVDRIEPGRDGRPKDFVQFRFDGGKYVAGLNGRKLPLYHLDRVLKTSQSGGSIFLAEGERKCDALQAEFDKAGSGVRAVATTIAGGAAAKLQPEHVAAFAGASKVIVLCDSDAPGRAAANLRARAIAQAHPNCDVRIVDLFSDRDDGSDVADFLETRTVADLHAIILSASRVAGQKPDTPEAEDVRGWQIESVVDLANTEAEEIEHDIEKIRPTEDAPTLVFGAPGSLKSWLELHACDAIVRGVPFLGRYAVKKRRSALYINIDAGAKSFRNRIRRVSAAPGFDFVTLNARDFSLKSLRKILSQYEGANVDIDCLSAIYNPDRAKDPAFAMREFVDELRSLYAEFGCGGAVIDHPHRPKERGELGDYYGSVQKEAAFRTMWVVTAEPPDDSPIRRVRIACRKMSEGPPFAPISAVVDFSGPIVSFSASTVAPIDTRDAALDAKITEWARSRAETFSRTSVEQSIRGHRTTDVRRRFDALLASGVFAEAGRRGSGMTYRLTTPSTSGTASDGIGRHPETMPSQPSPPVGWDGMVGTGCDILARAGEEVEL